MNRQTKKILWAVALWTVVVTSLHLMLNVDWAVVRNDYLPSAQRKLNVAYIPVTCHLACPVTDYITQHSKALSSTGDALIPRLFQGFPEIKEALIGNRIQAGFLVAPMALALRSQGVPIRIVYLGHRYGSSVVVSKNGPIRTVAGLAHRRVAIPNRFSDERLLLIRALKQNGVPLDQVKMLEMNPADVPGALATNAIDAFSMGEPFPSQAEIDGYGRVLFQARDYWPDYLSCVLVVRQDVIESNPAAVQALVDGIARSGLWLDQGLAHREYAADFAARLYYHQDPKLLHWALTQPLDRVVYNPLAPLQKDFDLIQDLMIETGVLDRKMDFKDYVDDRFAVQAASMMPWAFEPGQL
jgi:NitT/TauT family transport system substrate-binding protein